MRESWGAESILILRQSIIAVLLGRWPIYLYHECGTDKTLVFRPARKPGALWGLCDNHFSLIPDITLSPTLSVFLLSCAPCLIHIVMDNPGVIEGLAFF